MSALLSATDLVSSIESGAEPLILDVRWRLDKPDGVLDYEAGHIPGAIYVDLDTELAEHGAPSEGRHPAPSVKRFTEFLRRVGVTRQRAIVVYDDWQNFGAARAWWLLRKAGIDNVSVLDGGLAAWKSVGGPLQTGTTTPARSDISIDVTSLDGISMDEAASWPERGVLLDARAAARYQGDEEPLDPKAGHIPGALNLPGVSLLTADGTFAAPNDLRAAFTSTGVEDGTPTAVYCGSGVTASQVALAAHEVGLDIDVFVGSWSAWSNSESRPVATGAAPQ